MALDYVALGILIFLILFLLWIVLKLGALPGKIAEGRGHPQTDAIRVTGWVGILTMGVFWPLALIWSYTRTGEGKLTADESVSGNSEPEPEAEPSSAESTGEATS